MSQRCECHECTQARHQERMGAIGWKPLTHDGMTGHRSTSNLSKKPPIYNSGTFGFVNVGQELSKVHAITDPNDRPHLEIDLKP